MSGVDRLMLPAANRLKLDQSEQQHIPLGNGQVFIPKEIIFLNGESGQPTPQDPLFGSIPGSMPASLFDGAPGTTAPTSLPQITLEQLTQPQGAEALPPTDGGGSQPPKTFTPQEQMIFNQLVVVTLQLMATYLTLQAQTQRSQVPQQGQPFGMMPGMLQMPQPNQQPGFGQLQPTFGSVQQQPNPAALLQMQQFPPFIQQVMQNNPMPNAQQQMMLMPQPGQPQAFFG